MPCTCALHLGALIRVSQKAEQEEHNPLLFAVKRCHGGCLRSSCVLLSRLVEVRILPIARIVMSLEEDGVRWPISAFIMRVINFKQLGKVRTIHLTRSYARVSGQLR